MNSNKKESILKIVDFETMEEKIMEYLEEKGYLPPDLPLEIMEYFMKKHHDELTFKVLGIDLLEKGNYDFRAKYNIYCQNFQGRFYNITTDFDLTNSIEEVEEVPECKYKARYKNEYITCATWDNKDIYDRPSSLHQIEYANLRKVIESNIFTIYNRCLG